MKQTNQVFVYLVTVQIRSIRADGLCNFERIGDSFMAKSDVKWRLSSHVLITDLLFDLNFCANIAQIGVKHKNLRIFIEKCVVFVEISIDLMSYTNTKVTQIRYYSEELSQLNKQFEELLYM